MHVYTVYIRYVFSLYLTHCDRWCVASWGSVRPAEPPSEQSLARELGLYGWTMWAAMDLRPVWTPVPAVAGETTTADTPKMLGSCARVSNTYFLQVYNTAEELADLYMTIA